MGDSFIDPKTGDLNAGAANNNKEDDKGTPPPASGEPQSVSISQDEWNSMKTRLDVYERQFATMNVQNGPPPTPPKPAGPTFESQVNDLDQQINSLDDQIDKANEEGKPIKDLLRKQRKLNTKLTRLVIEHETIDPLRQQGLQTLGYLSTEITRSKMPYYDLVKDDMNAFLDSLGEEQRADPKIQEFAYKSCVGDQKVLNQILATEKEKVLREAATTPVPDASGSGRGRTKSNVPSAAKILGPQAMAALREKGTTPDKHYQAFGYEGWEDYWNKKGKEHFQDFVNTEE